MKDKAMNLIKKGLPRSHYRKLYSALAVVLGFAMAREPLLGKEKQSKKDKERAGAIHSLTPEVKCSARNSQDQDDMCIWLHPSDASRSIIIGSDKKANKLFVYDLEGKTIQTIPAEQPGNIDVRYRFPLRSKMVDIVAFNQRDDSRIVVYKVDAPTRQLQRVDNGAIRTGNNYGSTLYRSPRSGRFYFVITSEKDDIEQYELADDGAGKVTGKKVRSWRVGTAEGAVADDEAGKIYIGEEDRGIWEVGGEPDDPTPGRQVIQLGENGLSADVEGLALYYLPGGAGYLVVSNQGKSNFKVYEREAPHRFVGTFAVAGARATDGIDVCNTNLGPLFPNGLFACHTQQGNCPVLLTRWEHIARAIPSGLKIDTSPDRRK